MPERAQNSPARLWPWLAARLFPRGTNLLFWAAYVILIGLLISYILSPPPGLDTFRFSSSVAAVSAILVINVLWDDLAALFPTQVRGRWTLLLITSALAFYAIAAGRMYAGIYMLFMVAAQANTMLPGVPAITFSLTVSLLYLVSLFTSGASPQETQAAVMALLIGMTFTITLSQVLHRYTEQTERANHLLDQLRQANAELVAARQKEKDLAVAEERVRMARDLHDGLGHHLTALSIQLQAAEKLTYANPELAAEAVRNARGEVQAALKEVRQSVAALREAPVDLQNLPEAIAALAKEIGQRSGLEATFRLTGVPIRLTPTAAMTLFRAAQEGLTNVQKHAAAARRVEVWLVFDEEEIRLAVRDDGQAAAGKTGSGYGLPGLRERAQLLGGRLEHDRLPGGGFALEMTLPANAAREGAPG